MIKVLHVLLVKIFSYIHYLLSVEKRLQPAPLTISFEFTNNNNNTKLYTGSEHKNGHHYYHHVFLVH